MWIDFLSRTAHPSVTKQLELWCQLLKGLIKQTSTYHAGVKITAPKMYSTIKEKVNIVKINALCM